MSISYRQRGKQKTWDYRVFNKNKEVVASNSGFRTKKEAMIEATRIEFELMQGKQIDKTISLYSLWEKWFQLQILPQNKSEATIEKYKLRGRYLKEYFKDTPAINIKSSSYQEFINYYSEKKL